LNQRRLTEPRDQRIHTHCFLDRYCNPRDRPHDVKSRRNGPLPLHSPHSSWTPGATGPGRVLDLTFSGGTTTAHSPRPTATTTPLAADATVSLSLHFNVGEDRGSLVGRPLQLCGERRPIDRRLDDLTTRPAQPKRANKQETLTAHGRPAKNGQSHHLHLHLHLHHYHSRHPPPQSNPSIHPSINQSINQSINHSASQPASQPASPVLAQSPTNGPASTTTTTTTV
jgi:hypothetical protein